MKKLLYVAPHLSTGGLPQYLYKKIEQLKDEFEIYLIEWVDCTGGVLVVSRNKILNIIDSDKFFTLGEDKQELLTLINQINPDIIHLEEIPELFMDYEISTQIYSSSRKYSIIETSHDSSYDVTQKHFFPDKFMFVSQWQINQFQSLEIPAVLVEYPIEYIERPNRTEALLELGLDPNKRHILHIGLFTPRKNQAEFFKYAQSLPEYQFHCLGNQADNFKEYWGPLMAEKPTNLTWWNERTDVDRFYGTMDLFLFTSKGTLNDKETMPLVIREAVSYQIPILIYNLPVYLNYWDPFKEVNYLEFDNFEVNLNKIKNMVGQEPLEFWYDSETKKIHFYAHLEENFYIVLLDYKTHLPNYFTGDFPPHTWLWISSNAIDSLSGINLAVYDSNKQFIKEYHVVDFNRGDYISIDGEIVEVSRDDFDQSSHWSYHEIFIDQDYSLIPENAKVILDIGANIGLTTLYMLSKGAKQVYSFEPSSNTLKHLRKNTEKYPNVVVIDKAISYTDHEQLTFYYSDVASSIGTLSDSTTNSTTNSEQVNTININSFISQYNLDKIDYVKIDCEGGEKAFFETITDYNLKKIQIVEGEIHEWITSHQFLDFLKDKLNRCGFSFDLENKGDGLYLFIAKQQTQKPSIQINHLLTNPLSEREQKSISSLTKLIDYGFKYNPIINKIYTKTPPSENCRRPDDISSEPGHYKLASGHYGCYLAHKKGIMETLSDQIDAILLNECDSVIKIPEAEFVELVYKAYNIAKEYDLPLINFGKQVKNSPKQEINEDFSIMDQQSEVHCILIPTSKLPLFKEVFSQPWDTPDLLYNVSLTNKGIVNTPVALQTTGESLLDKGNIKFETYES
jgi:FkbM family methyltransferase